MDFVIGVVGVGTISSAVVRGLCTCDTPPKLVYVSPRSVKNAAALKAEFPGIVHVASDAQEVLDNADWVFLSTPPGPSATSAVLDNLTFRAEHTVVSFVAGVSPELLRQKCAATTIVQALPLPAAADHKSTTVFFPRNEKVESVFAKIGGVVPVDSFQEAMKIGTLACVMGDFYAHQRSIHQWLVGQGIESGTASKAIASYFNTFNHASIAAGPHGFDDLVAEQTPGGMNERVIADLTAKGNYDQMKGALDKLLPRLMG